MKLRIKGNSIRLRLTQREVDSILNGQVVHESVSFGGLSSTLHYELKSDPEESNIAAQFVANTITICLPHKIAHHWATSDQVGIEKDIPQHGGEPLYILVEKDFQCLHQRPREDEKDNFPNPAAQNNA